MFIHISLCSGVAAVGVFEEEFAGAREAFLEAVSDVNAGHEVSVEYTLLADVLTTPHDDSFTAAKKGIHTFILFWSIIYSFIHHKW